MADQRLGSVEVDGFASIRSASVSLGALNVLVGANGAGKSNFVRVFELLGRVVDRDLGLFVGLSGGASALLNVDAPHQHISMHLRGPDVQYKAILVPAANDELIFADEWVGYRSRGKSIGHGHRETKLHESATSVLAGEDSLSGPVIELLRGCRHYHFHDTSRNAPVKKFVPSADNLLLRPDAGNLAAFLLALRDSDREADTAGYRRIVSAVRLVAPFFQDFVLEIEGADRLRLRWRQVGSDVVFSADQMSDGTLRFTCLATLLLQPRLPRLVVLDEPELGLHPYAISQLAALLQQASRRSQVVVATQSVTLINEFALDEIIVVERENGGTVFRRPDSARLSQWLDDYSLGEVWQMNLIGGRPGPAGRGIA